MQRTHLSPRLPALRHHQSTIYIPCSLTHLPLRQKTLESSILAINKKCVPRPVRFPLPLVSVRFPPGIRRRRSPARSCVLPRRDLPLGGNQTRHWHSPHCGQVLNSIVRVFAYAFVLVAPVFGRPIISKTFS